ncbi:MAG: type I glutamate--ammonia ligase [Planctomycetales bacterium]|nr:type I glutamate--ammonia ligase [Planctomycetales bacterium]
MTPKEVLALCRKKNVKAIDFRFTDILGTWHHITLPYDALTEDTFDEGIGFDGSSIPGWQAIEQSDLLAVPQPETARVDAFAKLPTLSLICNIQDPLTREDYERDPRSIAQKACNYLLATGIADTAYFGPEAEFFVFDDVKFDSLSRSSYYELDSREAHWNCGREELPNLGHKLEHNSGYSPASPADSLIDLRNEMMQALIDCGLDVECHHHEVASCGQCEIDLKYQPLVQMADGMMAYKYIVRNVANQNGKTATFMPKPIFGENGSGMHTHFSLWKDEKPLFAGTGYAGLSDTALHAIAGILRHAPALLAITNPTTNSYKRLVPGYEAPVNLAYSQRNRSVACRIPMYSPNPKSKRIEFRCPDPTANPYTAFSAILLAAIDGIQSKLDPGEPLDANAYEQTDAEIPVTPGSLAHALVALQKDHDFLLRGDVFSESLINDWITSKRVEVDAIRVRPHPHEFKLYYGS